MTLGYFHSSKIKFQKALKFLFRGTSTVLKLRTMSYQYHPFSQKTRIILTFSYANIISSPTVPWYKQDFNTVKTTRSHDTPRQYRGSQTSLSDRTTRGGSLTVTSPVSPVNINGRPRLQGLDYTFSLNIQSPGHSYKSSI